MNTQFNDMAVIERERAEVDAAIGSMTLADVFTRNATDHPDRPALFWKVGDIWESMTWSEYRDAAIETAAGLISLGIQPGDFIALMSSNRIEHVIGDMGAVHAGATPVTLYSTLATNQVAYIAGHCAAKVAIIENLDYMKRWESAKGDLPNLSHIVLMEGAENYDTVDWVLSWDDLRSKGRDLLARDAEIVNRATATLTPDSLATLIYTSGTTGTPKGVMITHRNVLWTVEATDRTLDIPQGIEYPHPTVVSYLPLAHIAERMATHYLAIWKYGQVYYCPVITDVLGAVQEAEPGLFLGVPRIWEKFQSGLLAKLEAEPNDTKRRLAFSAIETGREVVRHRQAGERVPLGLKIRHRLLDKIVLSKVRHGLGMGNIQLAVTAAAPISADLIEFFQGLGLPLYQLYGMTESTGPGLTNRANHDKIGSVGQRYFATEVALADDDEILMRGGLITSGYFKSPEATAESYDADGWLHTGDLGRFDEEGYVTIIGRKKEMIVTSAGKNIAPAKLEGIIKGHPLVGQVCLIGDGRNYLTALVAIDPDAAPVWANKHGVEYNDFASFTQTERVRAELEAYVDAANLQVARVEQIKKLHIVADDWTPESGEMTPSLKLKRQVVHERYAEEIDALYN